MSKSKRAAADDAALDALFRMGPGRGKVVLPKKMNSAEERAYRRGAEHAAALASEYDGSSTHTYRLGDCILAKMNIKNGKLRKNRRRVEVSGKDWDSGWLTGFAQALIEIHQHRRDIGDLVATARRYGLTLGRAKRAGLSRPELKKLGHAGVPQ